MSRSHSGARFIPAVVGLQAVLTVPTLYLLSLLGAALVARRARPAPESARDRTRFLVLIPAHDEEAGISATLASVKRLDYPSDCFEAVVVADNCTDRTASVAAGAGATVLERIDASRRGKGHALSWALERLSSERPDWGAVVLVDADCQVSANLLEAVEQHVRGGASAVQANYVVSNAAESSASALRFAAFTLVNTVRPLGKSSLGLSCGLFGTGMGFTRSLLERQPWEAFSLAEDGEYHLRMVAAGERVAFAPEASVSSPMPLSLERGTDQQLRWEGGKLALIRDFVPRLVISGLRARDPVRLHAGLETLVPPQVLLAAGNAMLTALAAGLGSRAGLRFGAGNLAGQALFVLGGLLVGRAPRRAYRALGLAPVLLVSKLAVYARLLVGGGPTTWVRTTREPAAPDSAATASRR